MCGPWILWVMDCQQGFVAVAHMLFGEGLLLIQARQLKGL